ncbi:surface-adhesin E family protein [Chitinivorax sp. B]|uniref:surface-adhesin E family protein n=1 Tax=Chitinivorax sp. B TaxID=2502235 RepID=UPI0010F9A2AB|nr:surface-adhesin E family protein [Chitinivorax sp. B]
MKWYRLLCLFLPALSWGADWQALRLNDSHLHSIDQSKVLIDSTYITYWRKVVFSSPQTIRQGVVSSGLFRERIDCAQHTLLTLNWMLFDRVGLQVDHAGSADKEASLIVPDSLADQLETVLCRMIGQKRLLSPSVKSVAVPKLEPMLEKELMDSLPASIKPDAVPPN